MKHLFSINTVSLELQDVMEISDDNSTNSNTAEKRKISPTSKRLEELVTKESQMIQLCQILDTASNGWRDLGSVLGKSILELDWIQQRAVFLRTTPTNLLLREWQHGMNATVDVLLEALESIENHSAVMIIQKFMQESNCN